MDKKFKIILIIKKYFLVILSIIGIITGIIFSFETGIERSSPINNLYTPPAPPYTNNIAGIGIIETSSKNLKITSSNSGIVSNVLVKEGENVKKGDILFTLDQRAAIANLQNKKKLLDISKIELEIAQIEFLDCQDNFLRAKALKEGRSISEEALKDLSFTVKKVEANIEKMKTEIARGEIIVKMAEIELDKTSIRSPIDSIILKININPGEFIRGNEIEDEVPIILGTRTPFNIRVKIDENDIWRFNEKLKAVAFLRTNKNSELSLSFIRLEPYIVDKKNVRFTGIEIIDTRVAEIMYRIDSENDKLLIGQQLDVFIESDQSF